MPSVTLGLLRRINDLFALLFHQTKHILLLNYEIVSCLMHTDSLFLLLFCPFILKDMSNELKSIFYAQEL